MLNDDDFVRGFETGTLADFPHADHVRLTIIYLARHGRDEALRRLATGLLAFATAKGVPEKFHVTITRAWVELVDAARRTHPDATDAAELVAACPLLLEREALLRFYSRDRLNSPEARAGWLPPDHAIGV
jgi:hypothetical protein